MKWAAPPRATPPTWPTRSRSPTRRRRHGQRCRPASAAPWSPNAPPCCSEHVEELARLIALETGKALRTESRVEANTIADIFEFYGGLGGELKGESVPFAPTCCR